MTRVLPLFFAVALAVPAADPPAGVVSFKQAPGGLDVRIDDRTVAEYVHGDAKILRPYFRHLRTRTGIQVTRTSPPVAGTDADDHATMHPGLWLAFGDLGGGDFWRNKGRVKHVGFAIEPKGGPGRGSFVVRNDYEANGKTICTEECEVAVTAKPDGYRLDWASTITVKEAIAFGDQEEMGLGLRVATPLTVKKGGAILNADGRKDEAQVWGKTAAWCAYGGEIDRQRVGVVLMPDPGNFRPCWFHARDYGLLVANPFGRKAFTKGEASRVEVKPGEPFRLRFGVEVYAVPADRTPDVAAMYREYLKRDERRAP